MQVQQNQIYCSVSSEVPEVLAAIIHLAFISFEDYTVDNVSLGINSNRDCRICTNYIRKESIKHRGRNINQGIFKKLLVHNLKLNGAKAAVSASGLSASRYIEYSSAVKFFSKTSLLLEVGCGHSILPTFWERLGLQVVAVDLDLEALRWQKSKAKSLAVVCCDGRYQPFRGESVAAVSCISTIEHLPKNGDIQLAHEIGRILKRSGFAVVSLPLSPKKDHFTTDFASDIPILLKRVLGKFLPTVFRMFNVDRGSSYFERHYAFDDVYRRIVVPSNSELEDSVALGSKPLVKIIHGKIFPQGTLTLLEYLLAWTSMSVGKSAANMDAIILKLRKTA